MGPQGGVRKRDTAAHAERGCGPPCGEDGDSAFLDSQEQDALIASLEQSQAHSICTWKVMVSALCGGLLLFYSHAAAHHWLRPWELRHHAELRPELPFLGVIWAEILAMLSLVLTVGHSWKAPSPRASLLWAGAFATGGLVCAFWLPPILRSSSHKRWLLLWRPFVPLGAAALSWYVQYTAADLKADLEQLRGFTYKFKKV